MDSSREEDESDDVSNDSVDNCTVFEFGIDFLSVTRGDDLMDVFQRNSADTPRETSDSHGSAYQSQTCKKAQHPCQSVSNCGRNPLLAFQEEEMIEYIYKLK